MIALALLSLMPNLLKLLTLDRLLKIPAAQCYNDTNLTVGSLCTSGRQPSPIIVVTTPSPRIQYGLLRSPLNQ